MSSVDGGPAPFLGGRLGRYRMLDLLGRGGMGTVYLAEDETGRRVAIKVINREVAGSVEFRERFRREVIAAQRVRPFCTAPVLDADLNGDPLYLVTEFVEGPTLEQVVSVRGPLRGSELEGLAVGVATALSAIHSAGVIHRDLKPANILLSPFGPRVIDFGIARALEIDAVMTRTGETMGTPAFMAPEGLRGEQITAASDVFTWGCAMAYAGTGQPPFWGTNVAEILFRTVHEAPRLDGLEPPRLRDLVLRATAKDPALRPTAARLLEELTGQTGADRVAGAELMVPPVPEPRPPSGAAPATPQDIPMARARQPTAQGPAPQGPPQGPPPQGLAAAQGHPPPGAVSRPVPQQPAPGPWMAASDGRTLVAPKRTSARRWLLLSGIGALVIAAGITVPLMRTHGGGSGARGDGPPRSKGSLRKDDFSNPNSGWKNDNFRPGLFSHYANSAYVISQQTVGSYQVQDAPPTTPAENMMVGVTVRLLSGNSRDEAGVYCRGGDQTRYEILLAYDGSVRIRKVDGVTVTPLDVSATPVTGHGDMRLQATCTTAGGGTEIAAWVNGKPVVQATDTSGAFRPGKVGFVVGREGRDWNPPATAASFDDFAVDRI